VDQKQQTLVVRIIDLDITKPIDFATPVENLGGCQSLFISMLKRMETMSLNRYVNQVAESLNNKDWNNMKHGAHQLKGASGYVGAGRIHYACYHI